MPLHPARASVSPMPTSFQALVPPGDKLKVTLSRTRLSWDSRGAPTDPWSRRGGSLPRGGLEASGTPV